jgi:hypothetical protein
MGPTPNPQSPIPNPHITGDLLSPHYLTYLYK